MIMSDGLLRVFWPNDLPRSTNPGVIVGWRNSELDLFILTVLEDVDVCVLLCKDIDGKNADEVSRTPNSPSMSRTLSEPVFFFAVVPTPFHRYSHYVESRRSTSWARLTPPSRRQH